MHDPTTARPDAPPPAGREPEDAAAFRALFTEHPQPMWVYDRETLAFLEVNDAALAHYGYSRAEFLAMRITDIRPEEDVPRLLEALPRVRRGEPIGPGWRHRKKDGTLIDVEVRSHLLRFHGHDAVLVVAQDVTERRRAEEALRESEERYRQLIELSPDAIGIHSGGKVVFVNSAGARLVGASGPEQVIGRDAIDFIHPDDRPQVAGRLERLARGEAVPFVEERLVRLDGTTIDVEVGATPFTFRGAPAAQVVVRDISVRKRGSRLQSALFRIAELSGSAQDMPAFYASIHAIVGELMYAKNFYIALQDPNTRALSFAYFVDEQDPEPPALKPGKTLTEYVVRTGIPLLASPERFDALVASGEVETVGSPSVDWLGAPLKRGEQTFGVLVVQSYTPDVRFTDEHLDLLTFVAQHVSTAYDRKAAADALRESEARFRALAETAPTAIMIYQDERFRYVNAAAAAITGWTREQLLEKPPWELLTADFRELVRRRSQSRLAGQDAPSRYEMRIRRDDGEERWIDFSAGNIEYGGRPATLGIAIDITERKRAEEQIRNLAYHDALTGLPNRLLFNDRLSMAVAQAHRHAKRLAILFLDLDRFKVINDSLGHTLGDRLLQAVGARLEATVREGDTVARVGGDEFILLLPDIIRAEDAAKVAEKLLDSLTHPFKVDGRELFVTASVGISLFPEDGLDAESLVKNADTAMYRAKEQGRDNYQLYTHAMNETAVERLAMESSLRKALPREELLLHYQPIVDVQTRRAHGVEALLRWNHPDRGLVHPHEFIGLAEVTSLIVSMTPWVLRTGCRQVRQWHDRGFAGLALTVNISARQFQHPDLYSQIRRALDESGLPPDCLDLEITETHAMQNAEATIATLRELKRLGVRVSIDDFGIGYSSLSYLKRLPIDTLKIDQSFVRDITTDPDDAAIATAIIALAHTLKLRVVAEGVETEEQLAFLSARHCDRMQGYLFSPAVPPAECEKYLATLPRA